MENNTIHQEKESILFSGINLKKGTVEASHDLVICGNFDGTLISKAKVTIETTSSFRGTLQCVDFECKGKFDGKLTASNSAHFYKTCVVSGKVCVGNISVEEGATFTTDVKVTKGSKPLAAVVKK